MTASKKAKPKSRLGRKKRRVATTPISMAKQFIATFKDVNDLASFARKNLFRFVSQLKKSVLTKRGAVWPKK